jgi:cytosine deaminase
VEAIKRGWQGRCLAHHCRAMSLYAMPYFQKLCHLLNLARVPVVSDPHTGPLHARVKELLAAGVEVCLGQDDISDAYYPFGRNNMAEVAFLAAHLLWMTTRGEIETLYDMVTTRAARAINLAGHALAVGNPANLVVLGVPDVLEALREHAAPLHVISHGRPVDLAAMKRLAARPVAA